MSRLSAELIQVANQTQDLILESFKNDKETHERRNSATSAISAMSACSDEDVKSLGETGKRLKNFASRVNLQHPDLPEYLDGISRHCGSLYADAVIIMNAGKRGESDLLEENSNYERIVRRLNKPKTRLLKSVDERNNERLVKKQIKNVSMKSICNVTIAENCFFGRPSHFKRFARNSNYYLEELSHLDERINVFKEKGMEELSHAFAKRKSALQDEIKDVSGFFRLSPSETAIILARFHAYNWNDAQNNIIISGKFFDDYVFWTDNCKVTDDDILAEELRNMQSAESMKKSIIVSTRFVSSPLNLISFNFQPRMYPLAKFAPAWVPSKTKEILEKVELNQSPAFDYYWVLVPSIGLNNPLLNQPKDHWTIRDGNMNHVFQNSLGASQKLDEQLVREGFLMPVVLGERDGKCYFVCMWA